MDGVSFITDEKGNNKAVMLDIAYFKKQDIKAEDVIAALTDLQKWIDEAGVAKKENNWDAAKSKLEKLIK